MGGSMARMVNGYVLINNNLVICGQNMNGIDMTS